MENFVTLAIPALLLVPALRLLWVPMGMFFRLVLHCLGGFLCLWLLNCVSGYTGLVLPITPVTVLISGLLGIPGIGFIVLLEWMA